MKKVLLIIMSVIMTSGIFTSCDSEPSLQEYYVEKQSSNNFISLDVPSSIITLSEDASPETKEAMASIKKLNILAFKLEDANKKEYTAEYDKVKTILKNKKYNELMRMNHNGANIIIKYLGTDEAIEEFILFAADKNKGFALARILGDKMNPEKIMKLAQNINDVDNENPAFAQIEGLFKNMNN